MRPSDWSIIKRVSIWLSFILSFTGFLAIAYTGFNLYPIGYVSPNRNFGIVLFLFGIILFVLAYVCNKKYAEKVEIESHLR
jgi:hypothetical protein